VLALAGPTAAGKSTLAHLAALALGGEIVVADPFQRYRGLEIAADGPGAAARAEVVYHFAGDLSLTESSRAGGYGPAAHAAIDAILDRGRLPIVTGGTGLYLRAALADLDFPPDVADAVRADVDALVARDPDAAWAELEERDPGAARRVDARNPRRVARALALARAGLRPAAADRLWDAGTRLPTLVVAVTRPRDVLDRLIATRVRRELADGLVAEVAAALDTPGLSREARQIIGMAEVAAIRAGEASAEDLPERLAARTRRLARAQMTWLRKTPGVVSLDLGDAPAADAVDRLVELWRAAAVR
jgi:tRNA dimethylallyltransferase